MAAGAAVDQTAGEGSAAVDHAAEVDVEHPVELFGRRVEEGTRQPDAGVVDDDVGNPVLRAHLLSEPFDRLRVSHIEDIGVRRPAGTADLCGGILGRGPVDIADHDFGAVGGEGFRRFPADSAARPGHHDQGVPERLSRAAHFSPQQRPGGGGTGQVLDQFGYRGGNHLRM